MRRLIPCLLLIACAFPAMALAQTLNIYAPLHDPLSIARLDRPDFGPPRQIYGWGIGTGPDSANPGYYTLAEDTGAGMLTHFFMTSRTADSLTSYRLFVDGKLLRQAELDSFYLKPAGYLRAPLNWINGEARLCDVPIPYHRGFKILYKTTNPYNWYDYSWKPLPARLQLPASDLASNELRLQEDSALTNYRDPRQLWGGWPSHDTTFAISLRGGDSATILLTGGAIISKLSLKLDSYDTTLDSVWLEIYWDGSLLPAFRAPLLALFGQSYDFRPLHSLPMDFSQDSGFEMRLPMPFAVSARIVFRNAGSKLHQLRGALSVRPTTVDRTSLGYLHTAFSEILQTKYHVPHHVLHRAGRGRYIGLLMGIPNLHYAQDYEGDAIFVIDSNPGYSFHYGGTEDYFDGAMYFSFGEFSSPFAGTSNRFANYYRFHYLDAMDFRTSFDFDFQHGLDNDCAEHYRTLAFWYEQHIPFWTDRDTVRPGEVWHISGAGFGAGQRIGVRLDSIAIDSFGVKPNGSFDRLVAIPTLPPRAYTLMVGGVAYPEHILVTPCPTVQLLDEQRPLLFQTNDTIHLSGAGYVEFDSLEARMDGIRCTANLRSDAGHHLSGAVVVPELAEGGAHTIVVTGRASGQGVCPELLPTTRTLTLECEAMTTAQTNPGCGFRNNCDILDYEWSRNAVYSFRPDSSMQQLTLRFSVPLTDTYACKTYLSRGPVFGNFDVAIDAEQIARFDGYDADRFCRPDTLDLGTVSLSAGDHTLTFNYTGHDKSATDSLLWADCLRLVPLSPFKGLDSTPAKSLPLTIFPEPASDLIHIHGITSSVVSISITDILGRPVASLLAVSPDGSATINTTGLADGVYVLHLDTGQQRSVRLFHIVK